MCPSIIHYAGLLVDIQVNMTVHDYYLPNISLMFQCISNNYPPTSVIWQRNDHDIVPPGLQSSVLTDNLTTLYINELIVLELSDVRGNYTCEVNSISVMNYKHNISSFSILGEFI